MSIEEQIRKIVNEELDKRQQLAELMPLEEYCRTKKIARSTVWRHEKEGRIKLIRSGRKVYVNPQQFNG